ncbi:MAG: hypothetical protein H7Y18_10190 [Clostridiaceae bacterium]|nr:hypothetical protein [Clostridiaceae bacterium]
MELYGVVTMDLVGSRNIKNRGVLQEKLKKYFDIIYIKYGDSLISRINFTIGDEWQLITSRPEECYSIVHDFQRLLWEDDANFYAGIGIGKLETDIHEETRTMDGSCFIMARDAINIAKESSKKRTKFIYSKVNKVFFKSITNQVKAHNNTNGNSLLLSEVAIDSEDSVSMDDMINILIENNEILKNKLTNKQKKIYIDYLNYKSYRRIVEESKDGFNETIGGISQKLNSAEYFTIQRNHEMVTSLLSSVVSNLGKCKKLP